MKVTVRRIGAIRDVSFSLDKTTVITGNNGTGKTTLLLTLYALINAWAKEVKMKSLQVDDNFKNRDFYTIKNIFRRIKRNKVLAYYIYFLRIHVVNSFIAVIELYSVSPCRYCSVYVKGVSLSTLINVYSYR